MKEKNNLQLAALTASMVIFGTIGLFRRYIPLPSDVLAFSRGVMGSLFLLAVLRVSKKPFDRQAAFSRWKPLVISGAMIGLNWILLFEAYNYTTVAVATLCYYLQPIIVLLLSPLVVHEKITPGKVVCVAAALLGMLLVSGVAGGRLPQDDSIKGILLGLGAAVLYAAVVLMNRRIRGVPVYEKTIIQLASAAAVLLPYMLAAGTLKNYPMNAGQTAAFLLTGILHTGVAYALYFWSVERLRAQTSALFSYIDPVTAVLLSALLLHEPLSPAAAFGAVLILGAAAVSERF